MKRSKKKKVFVGLSGGVDSSVAAYLLQKKGYEVIGVHLRCWNKGGCDVNEAEYARRVAEHLNIPFYLFDLEKEYKKAVVDYMIAGYKKGITPNPDVMCNKEIKFGLFLKKALELGADYVATGHYVRLQRTRLTPDTLRLTKNESGQGSRVKSQEYFYLREAKDKNKDQSYFLWTLTQDQLNHSLFPIGDYLKSEVRAIARKIKLPTAEKKDSQGICFIGEVSIKDFLAEYLPKKKGKIVDVEGKVLGHHDGVQFYTIGQRHGLGIGGLPGQSGEPYYVADKNAKTNTLIVAQGEGNESLHKKEIEITDVNFPGQASMVNGQESVLCRVRYRQPLFNAKIKNQKSKMKVIFDKPQKFIAPGQSAVIYSKKGELLGGGVIL